MNFRKSLVINVLMLFVALSCGKEDKRLHNLYADLPFSMDVVQLPAIPANTVNLVDFLVFWVT